MIKTVDNFNSTLVVDKFDDAGNGFRFGEKSEGSYYFDSSAQVKSDFNISFAKYKEEHNVCFSLIEGGDKSKDDDELIISVSKNAEGKYTAKTGNYVGKFKWNGLDIDIRSRFSYVFMMRMLNFANDVFLDDVAVFDAKDSKDLDFSKFIICYMFVQKLEKAFLLGLPKSYRSVQHHEMKLKGRIDINRFIKHDIPFQGKISSVARERQEIQEIVNVLHKAVSIIDREEKSGKGAISTKNISHIKAHLKQHRSNQFVSNEQIQKALSSKALQNPIFAPYKKVLEYAKLIINHDRLEEDYKKSNKETFGFLVNVAELFEIYITKLLQKEFPDWGVSSPKIELYENLFYARKIIPDIVMQKDNQVLVFDTKYKRMKMDGRGQLGAGDLDRNDFFQINTYMTYYQQQKLDVIAGGLLYPMEGGFNEDHCHSQHWLDNFTTKFIVDGIELHDLQDSDANEPIFKNIQERERQFINRVANLMRPNMSQGSV